jgi:5-methylcytosine-specific restriction protein A
MTAVRKRDDIIDNIETLEGYIRSGKKEEKDFAIKAIREATSVLVYKVNGENHFAPARFVAYKNNKMASFLKEEEDAKDVINIMTKIVGLPFSNDKIVEKYNEYLGQFTKTIPDHDRQYWRIKDERRKNLDITIKE